MVGKKNEGLRRRAEESADEDLTHRQPRLVSVEILSYPGHFGVKALS